MAVKIKMLTERIIPVLYKTGEAGKVYKVNNEVAEELVGRGEAEYMDPEMMPKVEYPKEPEEKPEVETAMAEPKENAMMKRGRPRKYGKGK